MSEAGTISIEDVAFEQRDVEIFNIPDEKTRATTLQSYFFPRLEVLLRHTLGMVQAIYEVNPYEYTSFVFQPSPREKAGKTFGYTEAHIGIAGQRRRDRELTITKPDGSHYHFHPSYLVYEVGVEASMNVRLFPFIFNVDSQFVAKMGQEITQNAQLLEPIFAINHLSYDAADQFIRLKDCLSSGDLEPYEMTFFSPSLYLPVTYDHGLNDLVLAYLALFPLLDTSIQIAEGRPSRLPELLKRYKAWWESLTCDVNNEPEEDEAPDGDAPSDLPGLDGYKYIKPGKWWAVLARDNWTCCSCHRSAQKDGVTLNVDHIKPRSEGGTDDMENLQTLCWKCNIGKSNKDHTDLRHHEG